MTHHLKRMILVALCTTSVAIAGPIHLVTEDAYPFQYLENRQLTGMSVDIVHEMFKRAGMASKDELMSWQAAYDRAQLYPDTCVYSTARTKSRERLFKWIGPIVENKWAVFAKKGFTGQVSSPDDLKRYRIGVLQGDAKERYMKDLPVTFRFPESDDAANPPKLSTDPKAVGKIDLWMTGYYSGMHIAGKTGTKDIFPLWVFNTSQNYLACNYGLKSADQEKLQGALDAMKRDGTHAAIVDRYGRMTAK